jgi:hypothetical protein
MQRLAAGGAVQRQHWWCYEVSQGCTMPMDTGERSELLDILRGLFLEAQQMDVNDVRAKFGTKYDVGIQQMVKYSIQLLSQC